jgi:hypothetical protein
MGRKEVKPRIIKTAYYFTWSFSDHIIGRVSYDIEATSVIYLAINFR